MTRTALRIAAVLAFALSTSACSTLDDLIGDDTPSAPADANGFPPATAPDASAGTTPDLASVPEKPTGVTNPDSQKEIADSLGADRDRAAYSSDALRGGTEAAAPPPSDAPAPTVMASASPPPQPAPAAPPPDDGSSDAGSSDSGPPPATIPDSTPTPAPSSTVAAGTMPAIAPSPAPMSPSPMPAGTMPAVPAVGAPGAPAMAMNNNSLGFKPSTAPALDPSISQFVAQPIIARYQQTAANAGIATSTVAPAGMPAVQPSGRAVGGPETMSGSVVANLDAINAPTPSVYANASGMPPAAVVMFPGDTTAVNAAGRAQVRAAVDAFRARGGTGYIKVIGHSSSRTANMPVEKHLEAIFQKSQKRAQAVAAELIRAGVPARQVLVEAVGDSQPVYYESMPEGEDGNRRAEIFLQN